MAKNLIICQAESCKNTNRNSKLAFFLFPTNNPSRLKEWLLNIRMKQTIKSRQYLCSNHFELEAFTNTLKRRLLPNSVPSIQIPGVCRKESCLSISDETMHASLINIDRRDLMTKPDYFRKLMNCTPCTEHFADWCYTSTERKNLIQFAVSCKLFPPENNECQALEHPAPASFPSSEESIKTTPKIPEEVRSLQCTTSKAAEEEVLLQKLLQENFTASQYQFIVSQIRNSKCSQTDMHWSANDKALALSIYLQSASTYKLLRKYLNFPSITTLGCLMSNNNARHKEFYATVLKYLEKQSIEVLENDKLCIVSLDESKKSDILPAEKKVMKSEY